MPPEHEVRGSSPLGRATKTNRHHRCPKRGADRRTRSAAPSPFERAQMPRSYRVAGIAGDGLGIKRRRADHPLRLRPARSSPPQAPHRGHQVQRAAPRHGVWHAIADQVRADYLDVASIRRLVDTMANRMVLDPGSLDVILATNLHADILRSSAHRQPRHQAHRQHQPRASSRSTARPSTSCAMASPTRSAGSAKKRCCSTFWARRQQPGG